MKPRILLTNLLIANSVSLLFVSQAMARGPAAAPHMAAPAMHMAAPRMSAPVMHMSAPRMSAPAMHMSAPRMSAPMHMAAPRMSAPMHMSAPHMPAAHMSESMHMSHATAPMHMGETHNLSMHESRAGRMPESMAGMHEGREAHMPEMARESHGMTSGEGTRDMHGYNDMRHFDQRETATSRMGADARNMEAGHSMARTNDRPTNFEARQAEHFNPVTRSSPAEVRSEHSNALAHLQEGHLPQAEMRPGERAGAFGHAGGRQIAAAAAVGAAAGGMAMHHQAMEGQGSNEHRQPMQGENFGEHRQGMEGLRGNEHIRTDAPGGIGMKGTSGLRNVPPAPGYANPRQVAGERSSHAFNRVAEGGRLNYRPGTSVFPRQGDRKSGIPGIYDPGGYVRTPQQAGTRIGPSYVHQQLGMLPNWQRDMSFNQRNAVADRNAWPWHLPQQSVWYNPGTWGNPWGNAYFNQELALASLANNPYAYGYGGYGYGGYPYGYGGNPYGILNPFFGYPYGVYGPADFWNSWNDYNDWDSWNNQYANGYPYYGSADPGFFGMLGNMFGGGEGVGLGSGSPNNWLSNLLYFNAYNVGGNSYQANYFAMNGYVPTPYVFNVSTGQFWQPGVGYSDYLPSGYRAPITVSVQESLPVFGKGGRIIGYQPQTFYNDAYWDNNAQSYGYYDYRKKFHWLTFPWLSSYASERVAQ